MQINQTIGRLQADLNENSEKKQKSVSSNEISRKISFDLIVV
jgi:hypothetical protein